MNHSTEDGAGGIWRGFPPLSAARESGKRKLEPKARMLLAIAITIVVTLLVTVAFLNLRAEEKQIRYERTYRVAVTDPPFVRSGNHLPRPSMLRRQV